MAVESEFEVYRSLGYLSTGDVLTETKLSKGELFYLLNTGFPLVEPVQVPYEAFDQQVRAYLFSTRDVYVLKLIKNMKKKYSLQRLRGMLNVLLKCRNSEELDDFAKYNYKLICQTIKEFGGELILTKEER